MIRATFRVTRKDPAFDNIQNVRQMRRAAVDAGMRVSRRLAERLVHRIREAILTQGASVGERWDALSRGTIKRRGAGRTLIHTGALLHGIKAWPVRGGMAVGAKPGDTHFPSGLLMQRIVDIHEFGVPYRGKRRKSSRSVKKRKRWRIPPRPFLGPAFRQHTEPEADRLTPWLFQMLIRFLTKHSGGRWITRVVG